MFFLKRNASSQKFEKAACGRVWPCVAARGRAYGRACGRACGRAEIDFASHASFTIWIRMRSVTALSIYVFPFCGLDVTWIFFIYFGGLSPTPMLV